MLSDSVALSDNANLGDNANACARVCVSTWEIPVRSEMSHTLYVYGFRVEVEGSRVRVEHHAHA